MDLLVIIILSALVYIGIIGLIAYIIRSRKTQSSIEGPSVEGYCVFEILVPKNNDKGPLAAENLYATLHGIYDSGKTTQEQISLEIISKNQTIRFFVHVPLHMRDYVEGQIYAQYPSIEIIDVEDYTKSPSADTFAGADLLLNKSDVFPIKTFDNFEVDPLAGITGVLSKASLQEEIWLQMIIRPVPDTWQKRGIDYIQAIRKGESPGGGPSFTESLMKGAASLATDVIKTAASGSGSGDSKKKEAPKEIKLSGPEEVALKGIETKVAKLGFESKIRVIAFSENESAAKLKVTSVVSAFKQFNMTNLNGFTSSQPSTQDFVLNAYKSRAIGVSPYVLNIQEIASIYHLPSESVSTPSISWAGSKKGEPPANLPIEGVTESSDLTLFGKTNFRHLDHRFGIKTKDRRLHMYAIGKTGVGKSTMLENMIIDDINEGRGVAVVDPHGDLIDHVLDFIPEDRIKDVVYFAPADRDFPVGFNILESVDPDLKSIVASGAVGIFKKIFGESWGPRLEYILRNSILALLDYPGATMLGIIRLLVDRQFRADVVDKIGDPVIKSFWMDEYEKYDQKFRTEAIAPIQNKVGQFLSSATIRNIVGQSKSSIVLKDIMDNKKILLVNLSIGKIGEDTAALLGAMMITKIQLSAMERASIPENERVDFYLYVDEFQNFATDSFATILSEARKYRLNLVMTNQYIAQMPEVVQKAVFGNVGTLVSFRVGVQDAPTLAKEFEPIFEANDLVNLGNHNIYTKMAIDGVTSPAFSALTLPPFSEKKGFRDQIIEASRKQYSRSREEVEGAISEAVEKLSASASMPSAEEKAIRYPRQFNDEYVELKDKKTGRLFYTKEKLETVTTDTPEIESPKENSVPVPAQEEISAKIEPIKPENGAGESVKKPGILAQAIEAKQEAGERVFKQQEPVQTIEEIKPIEDTTTVDI